jgi:hypothetical protein
MHAQVIFGEWRRLGSYEWARRGAMKAGGETGWAESQGDRGDCGECHDPLSKYHSQGFSQGFDVRESVLRMSFTFLDSPL